MECESGEWRLAIESAPHFSTHQLYASADRRRNRKVCGFVAAQTYASANADDSKNEFVCYDMTTVILLIFSSENSLKNIPDYFQVL